MYTIAHTNHHTPIDSSSDDEVCWVVSSDGDSSDEGISSRLPIRKAFPHLSVAAPIRKSIPWSQQPLQLQRAIDRQNQRAIDRQNRLPRALQCLLPFNKAGIKEAAL
jgi:hypothetical protein